MPLLLGLLQLLSFELLLMLTLLELLGSVAGLVLLLHGVLAGQVQGGLLLVVLHLELDMLLLKLVHRVWVDRGVRVGLGLRLRVRGQRRLRLPTREGALLLLL